MNDAEVQSSRVRRNPAALIADHPMAASAAFVLVVTAIFLLFPGIDPWFSGLFYTEDKGFTLAHSRLLIAFRRSSDVAYIAIIATLVAALVAKIAKPERASIVPPNVTLFLLTTLALGPGIVVNLVLKNHWGRPRPVMVEQFGGIDPFVGVWRITDYCATNCSFVSGEASSAIWLTSLAFVVPAAYRVPTAILTGTYALLIALNRIAFGGHFLSDVLLAFGLTLFVIALLYRVIIERPPAWLANERLEAGLTRFGRRLRGATGEV